METVWELAGSTILTPTPEHCSFCFIILASIFPTQNLNPKSTGHFSPGTALGGGGDVFHPLCKIISRHNRTLELTGLIA